MIRVYEFFFYCVSSSIILIVIWGALIYIKWKPNSITAIFGGSSLYLVMFATLIGELFIIERSTYFFKLPDSFSIISWVVACIIGWFILKRVYRNFFASVRDTKND